MPLDIAKLRNQLAPLILPASIGGALAYHFKGKSYPAAALGAVAGAFVGSLIMPKAMQAATPAVPAPTPEPEIDVDRARLVRSEAERNRLQLHEVATLPRALQLAMTDEVFARYWERRLIRHPEDQATMIAVAQERGRRWVKKQRASEEEP